MWRWTLHLPDGSPGTVEGIDAISPRFVSLRRRHIPVSYTHLTLPTNREV